jgi:pyruvoyl-dependent arginine decarboxylase (PvlArgDC)
MLETSVNLNESNGKDAAEIIQEIERLPELERGKVVEFVEGLKSTKQIRYIDSSVVEQTGDQVLREHAPLFKKLAE